MSRKKFKARSRTFPFAFTHSDALVVVDDLAPGHISEIPVVSDCSSRSSLVSEAMPGCCSNCSCQIRRLALLERIPQNCSYLAVHKLKSAGSGIALKAKLSQFVIMSLLTVTPTTIDIP